MCILHQVTYNASHSTPPNTMEHLTTSNEKHKRGKRRGLCARWTSYSGFYLPLQSTKGAANCLPRPAKLIASHTITVRTCALMAYGGSCRADCVSAALSGGAGCQMISGSDGIGCSSHLVFSHFFCPVSLPRRNSDPGSLSRLFSPSPLRYAPSSR